MTELERLRKSAGLTMDQVATAARRRGLKWTHWTVGAIEAGRRHLSLSEFEILRGAVVANQELAQFFTEAASRDGGFSDDVAAFMGAEMNAARKIGVSPDKIVEISRRIWGKTLTEERDRLTSNSYNRRKLQTLRGHTTRQLLRKLASAIQEEAAS